MRRTVHESLRRLQALAPAVLIGALAIVGSGCGVAPTAFSSVPGFRNATCAFHDPVLDRVYVSWQRSDPAGGRELGAVGLIDSAGTVLAADWLLSGRNGVELDRPVGIARVGDELWVADQSRVRRFDPNTGTPLGTFEVVGARRLYALVADGVGGAYATDLDQRTVLQITADGGSRILVREPKGPSALSVHDGRLFAVSSDPAEFAEITDHGWERREGFSLGTDGLTGLARLGDEWLVTATSPGALLVFLPFDEAEIAKLRATGKDLPNRGYRVLIPSLDRPMALAVDAAKRRAFIPVFGAGEVLIADY